MAQQLFEIAFIVPQAMVGTIMQTCLDAGAGIELLHTKRIDTGPAPAPPPRASAQRTALKDTIDGVKRPTLISLVLDMVTKVPGLRPEQYMNTREWRVGIAKWGFNVTSLSPTLSDLTRSGKIERRGNSSADWTYHPITGS